MLRFLLTSVRGEPHNVYYMKMKKGDLDQWQRDQALSKLKDGTCKILFATDVASRRLDIKGVSCVMNYSPPGSVEDYVHRIGRTGRAGAKGIITEGLDTFQHHP